MLTRKQMWRRVRSRPRTCSAEKGTTATASPTKVEVAVEAFSSTSTSISTSLSFESTRSLDEDDIFSFGDAAKVTFDPMVEVFLVENKRELDKSSKRALWWTPREAAVNKKAWLKHIGQPGCGRESVGRLRQAHVSNSFGYPDFTGGGGGGGWINHGEMVGVLGCRCLACLTEGDDINFFGKGSGSSTNRRASADV